MRIWRILSLIVTGLAIATAARADDADLAWNRCAGLLGASASESFACNDNGLTLLIAPTVTTIYDTPNVVGAQVDVDVISDAATLPDWWRFGAGECRDGSASFLATMAGVGDATTCKRPWATSGVGTQATFTTPIGSQLNRLRIRGSVAQTTPVTLVGGQRYLVGVIQIATDRSYDDGLGGAVCAGCSSGACLALQTVRLFLGDGSTVVTVSPTNNFLITYNQAAGTPCVVPTRPSTWGAIKAMYR